MKRRLNKVNFEKREYRLLVEEIIKKMEGMERQHEEEQGYHEESGNCKNALNFKNK